MRIELGLIVTVVAACGSPEIRVGPEPVSVESYLRGAPRDRLDVLLVIDNSISMQQEQDSLAARFEAFVTELEAAQGGMPDLQLAVISTDVGIGPYGVGNCQGDGDDGRFRLGESDDCRIDGAYLRYARQGEETEQNFEGALTDAVGCMVELGTNGCGFEQPLESTRRALAGPALEGFLRDDAALAIVMLGDEDDCSAADPAALFDPGQDMLEGELGPFASYRCFEYGVVCEPDAPRELPLDGSPAPQEGCVPREDSALVRPVAAYVDELMALKPNPLDVSVTVINGDPDPVAIRRFNIDMDAEIERELMASCETPGFGSAAPAVRLATFAAALPLGGFASICDGDLGPAMAGAGATAREALAGGCLRGSLRDADSGQAGLQPACEVARRVGAGDDAIEESVVACDGAAAGQACWRLVEDPAVCARQDAMLRVELEGARADPNEVYVARCIGE